MSRWFRYFSLLVGGLGMWAGGELSRPALAQDGAMTELYGYGVHRFYAGDYAEAQRVLNMVIEAGIEDPRPHFFRGLTQYQLGALDAAQADFEHAATLEARGRRAINVSFALQRVQGPVRHDIEMARMMARVAVYREQMTQPQTTGGAPRGPLNVPVPPTTSGADIGLPPSLAPDAAAPAEPPPSLVPDAAAPVVPPPADGMPPAGTATPPPDTEVDPFRDDQPVPAPATEPAPAPGAEPASPFETPAEPAAPATPAEPAAPADPFSTSTEPAAPAVTPEASSEAASDATPAGTPEAPAAEADPFAN